MDDISQVCTCTCSNCGKTIKCKCSFYSGQRYPYQLVSSNDVKKWFFTNLLARSKGISVTKFYGMNEPYDGDGTKRLKRDEYADLRKKLKCLSYNRWVAINKHVRCETYDNLHKVLRRNYIAAVIPGFAGCIDEVHLTSNYYWKFWWFCFNQNYLLLITDYVEL